MSRWLSNVGNFLDQLDTKAAVVVNSAVSGRHDLKDDDDDDGDDNDDFDNLDIGGSTLGAILYQPTASTGTLAAVAPLPTGESFHEESQATTEIRTDAETSNYDDDDYDEFLDERIGTTPVRITVVDSQSTALLPPLSQHVGDPDDEGLDLKHDGNIDTAVNDQSNDRPPSSVSKMDIESDGWKDDNIDEIAERSNRSIATKLDAGAGTSTSTSSNTEDSNKMRNSENSNKHADHDTNILLHSEAARSLADTETSANKRSDVIHTETHTSDAHSGHLLEQINTLQLELQQSHTWFQQMQQDKQKEVQTVTKEARTLRRHLATMNEQLAVADREVAAQRQELDSAAQRIEKDRIKYKQDIQALQTKHNNEMQQMKQSHQDACMAIQAQAQYQMEALKKELSEIHQQRQQEGGDWHLELADAIRREQLLREECQSLLDEKDTIIGQIDTLRSQQESLGSRLESLTAIADSAAIREREAEVQLDNAMTVHAKQISQRQAREAELERTVSELSALLAVERAKNANVMKVGIEVTSSPGDITSQQETNSMAVLELERMKTQLELERQKNSSLRTEIDEMVQERQEEAILAQTRLLQHEKKCSELTQQLLELRATVRGVKEQDYTLQQQRPKDEAKLDAQRIQDLSEDLIRMRERISVSNSEAAALRNRLQAALNRVIVAEAAAESAYTVPDHNNNNNNTWSNSTTSGSIDPEHGLTVRRRGTSHRSTNNISRSSSDVPTIRRALRLDVLPGGGNESNAESIGKGLDILDSFLAQSGEILRFNPIARLCFVVYLLLLHFWTFALLIFHAHGFETIHNGGSGMTQPHGPGALIQQAAIVNVPNGN